ncbi:MAG: SAM-dependent methyltransferase [Burkholderiales bacterium]|nr:SAM-dependent methyltransferase [Burkholderiales bacterium]
MSGTLWLLPATLGDPKGHAAEIADSLPPAVLGRLSQLRVFAVENAKAARAFLKAAQVPLPIAELTLHEIGHAPDAARLTVIVETLRAGVDVGLIAEAGCPAVADPGALLVRMAHEADCTVAPLVGPSALLLALMASGLEGQRFAFAGYLPVKPGLRERAIGDLEARSRRHAETQIVIEAPFRNQALFAALVGSLARDTRLAVASDLTLPSQSIAMRKVSTWRSRPAPALDRRPTVFLFLA